jgi:hypothetical protein
MREREEFRNDIHTDPRVIKHILVREVSYLALE